MLAVTRATRFKRDYKRCKKRGKDVAKLFELVKLLAAQDPLPKSCRDHALRGKWVGYRELHIQDDWLLVYKILPDVLLLVGTGTHADPFN